MSATKTTPATAKHANIAAALAAFQAAVPKVEKGATAKVETRTGGSYTYQYADLAVVTDVAMPLLGAQGLAFTTRPTLVGDRFVLHYALIHESGEVIEGEYPLANPTSMKPQEVGSAITYARRYTFCAVTGIAPGGDDDDANSVNDRPAADGPARQTRPAPTPEPEPPSDGLERRAPSEDWLTPALAAVSRDELRPIYAAAQAAGDLAVAVRNPAHEVESDAPEFISLDMRLRMIREPLPESTPASAESTAPAGEAQGDAWTPAEPADAGDWPTAQVPE